MKNTNTLTYKKDLSKQEGFRVLKAVGLPILIFGLSMFTIQNFANFGSKLICPLIAAMWVVGFVVALLMPSQRSEPMPIADLISPILSVPASVTPRCRG